MIELGKKYKTVCGFPVELTKINDAKLGLSYPVLGMYQNRDGGWWCNTWTLGGKRFERVKDDLDLIEVPNFETTTVKEIFMIDITKKYITGLDQVVELYKKQDFGMYPIIGAVKLEHDNEWIPNRWTIDGVSDKYTGMWDLFESPDFKALDYVPRVTRIFVDYFGIKIQIPSGVEWLVTDANGILRGYYNNNEPILTFQDSNDKHGYWYSDYNFVNLASINFVGNWKESKLKVNND